MPCHCVHLDALSAQVQGQQAVVTGFGVVRTEALNAQSRIIQAEAAMAALQAHASAQMRTPPGVDTGAEPRPAFMPYMRPGTEATDAMAPAAKTYRAINDIEKLFCTKDAQDSMYACSAGDKEDGEKWRRTIRGYFVSRNSVLAPILDFLEHENNVEGITLAMMEEECRLKGWMVEDLERMSELLWGFLNICLKAEAKDDFEEADELDGSNGWRVATRSIRKSAYIHHATVRRQVKYTPPIGTLEEVPAAIKRHDSVHEECKSLGGTAPSDSEKKTDLLELLPKDIREQLQWRAPAP
jgi:hypothetical protein